MQDLLSNIATGLLITKEYSGLKENPVRFSLPHRVKNRILPIYDKPLNSFKKFYDITNNGELHAYVTNYGFMVYPDYQMENADRISEKLLAVENTPIELPGNIPLASKTITYAYATLLSKTSKEDDQIDAFKYLLIEETSTGRKSLLSHRHMLKLSKIENSSIALKNLSLLEFDGFCNNDTLFPTEKAKIRLRELVGDIMDYAKNNIYIYSWIFYIICIR
jgi:hypothetical protein